MMEEEEEVGMRTMTRRRLGWRVLTLGRWMLGATYDTLV